MTGNSFVYDKVIGLAFAGSVLWPNASDKIYIVLGNIDPTNTNKYTWDTYYDLKYSTGLFEIAAVNGYALGGGALDSDAPVLTTATHVTKFPAGTANAPLSPTVFTTTASITCDNACTQYAASSSTADNPIISQHDLGAQTASNGTLTLTWSADGVWAIDSSSVA